MFCETPLARWSIRPLCEKNSLFKGGSSGSRISSQLGEHNDLWELKEVLKDDEVHSFSSNPLILLIAPDEGGDVLRSSSLGDMKIEMDEGEDEDDNDDMEEVVIDIPFSKPCAAAFITNLITFRNSCNRMSKGILGSDVDRSAVEGSYN